MTVLRALAAAAAILSLTLGATPTPPPGSGPTAHPTPTATAPARTLVVTTADELDDALYEASPGDTIALSDGTYSGAFTAAASGTADAPITLTGTRSAVLTTGSYSRGYALHITGSYWNIDGISVTKSGKGIVLDGSKHTTISDVEIGNIGAEGVHFRANSSDGVLEDSVIRDTGIRRPGFGEGVYIGSSYKSWKTVMGSGAKPDRSDRVTVRDNTITTTAGEGVDAKEGTTGGSIVGNTFRKAGYSGTNSADSWIDIAGNGYTVSGNSGSQALLDAIQVHTVRSGWGKKNTFSDNTVLADVPGYTVWIDKKSTGNTVACGESDAGRGLTTSDCSG